MKKKMLTTAMALAMLAPTMTSFASTDNLVGGNQRHEADENNSINTTMGVGGTVRNAENQAPEGRIEVVLPTSISFVVNPDGGRSVQTPTAIQVTNNSSKANIVVSVANFTDSNPGEGNGIEVKPYQDIENGLEDHSRAQVGLKLSGTYGGKPAEVDLGDSNLATNKTKILNVNAGSVGTLSLQGIAGTNTEEHVELEASGTSDQFTITFEIKKDK